MMIEYEDFEREDNQDDAMFYQNETQVVSKDVDDD